MILFIVVVLGLALYGAMSLLGGLFASASAPKEPPVAEVQVQAAGAPEGGVRQWLTDSAMNMAAASAGLEFAPLDPELEGCSASILAPSQVENLVLSLPEPQRSALAKVMVSSASVWTAQLYTGPRGTGLCLPNQSKLVVFSGISNPLSSLNPS
ncbi:hypothetical protein LMG26857_03322 [Achromobacter anxifer]|uniref:hypothetical protein n=1 Tax=Achromobacter anxifer TaxID=1287737 RepID=UPI00155BDE6F|nr:hypothetical protein [Achromobacter anxifer]CAB5514264.1 hypothetical protein LMG26857_03322 [Achromobacter anxifer]